MMLNNKKSACKNFMIGINETPTLSPYSNLKDVIDLMNDHKLGSVCIVDKNNYLRGIITDGDIRRKLISVQKPLPAMINDELKNYYSNKPKYVSGNMTILKALKFMNNSRIWDLPVVDKKKKLVGILHLQHILKKLLFNK